MPLTMRVPTLSAPPSVAERSTVSTWVGESVIETEGCSTLGTGYSLTPAFGPRHEVMPNAPERMEHGPVESEKPQPVLHPFGCVGQPSPWCWRRPVIPFRILT
jgi:hypothetical protein